MRVIFCLLALFVVTGCGESAPSELSSDNMRSKLLKTRHFSKATGEVSLSVFERKNHDVKKCFFSVIEDSEGYFWLTGSAVSAGNATTAQAGVRVAAGHVTGVYDGILRLPAKLNLASRSVDQRAGYTFTNTLKYENGWLTLRQQMELNDHFDGRFIATRYNEVRVAVDPRFEKFGAMNFSVVETNSGVKRVVSEARCSEK